MIVNNEQQKEPVQVLQKEPEQTPQKEPTKKFNTERAYEWLYNLSGESRDFYDDTRVAKYSNEFIKNRFNLIYTQLGKPMPPQEELDSLYLSFFDEVKVEKKIQSLLQNPKARYQRSLRNHRPLQRLHLLYRHQSPKRIGL